MRDYQKYVMQDPTYNISGVVTMGNAIIPNSVLDLALVFSDARYSPSVFSDGGYNYNVNPITLQRHFSVLTKFAHVELRVCGRKGRGKTSFDVPVNPCVRSICSRSVAVGITWWSVTYPGVDYRAIFRMPASVVNAYSK